MMPREIGYGNYRDMPYWLHLAIMHQLLHQGQGEEAQLQHEVVPEAAGQEEARLEGAVEALEGEAKAHQLEAVRQHRLTHQTHEIFYTM